VSNDANVTGFFSYGWNRFFVSRWGVGIRVLRLPIPESHNLCCLAKTKERDRLDKLEVKTLPRIMFRTWETMRKGRRLGCGDRVMRCRYIGTGAQYQPASPVNEYWK